MNQVDIKRIRQARRVKRVRKNILGTPQRPRLAVARSNRNIEVQVIDDLAGKTLCAVSSRSKDLRDSVSYGGNVKAAAEIGKAIAAKAKALGIEAVRFDRRGRRYHGRVKALADAAREAGLKF
jgi:large subunit ribosomal protein L18